MSPTLDPRIQSIRLEVRWPLSKAGLHTRGSKKHLEVADTESSLPWYCAGFLFLKPTAAAAAPPARYDGLKEKAFYQVRSNAAGNYTGISQQKCVWYTGCVEDFCSASIYLQQAGVSYTFPS